MQITEAKVVDRYRVSLRFDNLVAGVVDLSGLAGCGVFAAWLQPGVFEQLAISPVGALEWPGGLDLCADALYLQMTGKAANEIFPAMESSPAHA